MALRAGDVVGTKYRLLGSLAGGGMGTIWSARHVELDINVAIKFSTAGLSPKALDRFKREARATARLQSPHIVQIHDFGVHGDFPYIVMEMLRGEDLSAYLARVSWLELGAAARITEQAARALTVAHEAGIIHRDIKLGNLFLARVGDEEVLKLVDFGIAKEIASGRPGTATTAMVVLGSPAYMSPEQVRAEELDHRTDLWSLSVVLFRMLTGVNPFKSTAAADSATKICEEPIPAPSAFNPGLDDEVDRFFRKALARDRNHRFQSARELADAFAAVVEVAAATRLYQRPESSGAVPARQSTPASEQERGAAGAAPFGPVEVPQVVMRQPAAGAPGAAAEPLRLQLRSTTAELRLDAEELARRKAAELEGAAEASQPTVKNPALQAEIARARQARQTASDAPSRESSANQDAPPSSVTRDPPSRQDDNPLPYGPPLALAQDAATLSPAAWTPSRRARPERHPALRFLTWSLVLLVPMLGTLVLGLWLTGALAGGAAWLQTRVAQLTGAAEAVEVADDPAAPAVAPPGIPAPAAAAGAEPDVVPHDSPSPSSSAAPLTPAERAAQEAARRRFWRAMKERRSGAASGEAFAEGEEPVEVVAPAQTPASEQPASEEPGEPDAAPGESAPPKSKAGSPSSEATPSEDDFPYNFGY